jgi:microcompartment protein CcmK/EutM
MFVDLALLQNLSDEENDSGREASDDTKVGAGIGDQVP